MSRRSYSRNAYESGLTSGVDNVATTITVESAAGIVAPSYMVLDPEDAAVREYVKVTNVNVNTLTIERGLTGSASPSGSPHVAGAKLRSVAVGQWLEDIFSDIEDLEQADTDHVAAPDPHPVYLTQAEGDALYLALAGGTMAGPIAMGNNKITGLATPTADPDAATKGYVDFEVSGGIGTHEADVDAHHARYDDTEAVAAMGAVGNSNPLNHARYTDAEAIAAVDLTNYYTKAEVDALLAGKAASAHTHAAADTTSGEFAVARIPNLAASKITSGVFAVARIPDLNASKIQAGTFGAGAFTFNGGLGVQGAIAVTGTVDFPGIPSAAGTNDLRWNSGTGALSYA